VKVRVKERSDNQHIVNLPLKQKKEGKGQEGVVKRVKKLAVLTLTIEWDGERRSLKGESLGPNNFASSSRREKKKRGGKLDGIKLDLEHVLKERDGKLKSNEGAATLRRELRSLTLDFLALSNPTERTKILGRGGKSLGKNGGKGSQARRRPSQKVSQPKRKWKGRID